MLKTQSPILKIF